MTDVAQTQRKNGIWREMLNGWMSVLTKPNLDTFRALKARADPLQTVLGVGLLGLVLGLLALSIKPADLVAGMGTGAILVEMLRMIFFTEADFFIIGLFLFVIAKGFGGIGSFSQQSYLLSLITVPLGMIVIAFLFVGEKLGLTLTAVLNPLSAFGVIGVFIILFALYGFLLLLFALQATHEMKPSAVVYTLGILLIVWGILRVVTMFVAGEENIITIVWGFFAEQWVNGTVQELLIGPLVGIFLRSYRCRGRRSDWCVHHLARPAPMALSPGHLDSTGFRAVVMGCLIGHDGRGDSRINRPNGKGLGSIAFKS